MNELVEELRTYREQVQWLFQHYPETYTDYRKLDFLYLKIFCGLGYLKTEDYVAVVNGVHKLSVVERVRRSIRKSDKERNNERYQVDRSSFV